MERVRLLAVIVALAILAVGGSGTASAQSTSEDICADPMPMSAQAQRCAQFVTLIGPEGQQVALFCAEGQVIFSVRLDGGDEPVYAGAPRGTMCFDPSLQDVMRGYAPIMNTSPKDGWVIVPWSGQRDVSQCQNGMLTTVRMGPDPSEHPVINRDPSSVCGGEESSNPAL